MPVSKNRRRRRRMTPRDFTTQKSARRYLKRFTARFFYLHRDDERLARTMARAFQVARGGR